MNLDKEFIPYEQALALKELGFDEPCFGNWQDMKEETPWFSKSYADNQNQYYGQLCSAPTFSQAFRWFREKYRLIHNVQMSGIQSISYDIRKLTEHHYKTIEFSFCSLDGANTYEKAELACLKKLIEIVKNR